MSYEEYLNDVGDINVFVLIANENLDPHNFDDPIKKIFIDKYIITIDPKDVTYMNYFIRQ